MFFSLMPFYSHVLALFNNSSVHLGIPERVIVLQIRSERCNGWLRACLSLSRWTQQWPSVFLVTLYLRISKTILGQLC